MAQLHDWDPGGWWFKPQCSYVKITADLGPLNKGFNPSRGFGPCLVESTVSYEHTQCYSLVMSTQCYSLVMSTQCYSLVMSTQCYSLVMSTHSVIAWL